MPDLLFLRSFLGNFCSRTMVMLLLCTLGAFPHQAPGQTLSDSTALNVGLRGHYGFIIPHISELRHISDTHPWGLELDLSWHFGSRKAWEYLHTYPRLGASLAYYNFGNPEVIGNAYSLLFYAEPFLSAHKNFSLSFRLGGGFAYLTQPHDPETNPDNLFYSTAISFPLAANLMTNYKISETILLRAGATYQHISNGGISQPNKGINFPTFSAGMDYALQPAAFPERTPKGEVSYSKNRTYTLAAFGTFTDSPTNSEEHLPLLGAVIKGSQRISRLSALTLAGEWVADYTLKEKIKQDGADTDFRRGALLTGHELVIGRARLSQELGIYVYAPYEAPDPVYQRYGLTFRFGSRLFLGFNLKAHRFSADFLDLRIGIHL